MQSFDFDVDADVEKHEFDEKSLGSMYAGVITENFQVSENHDNYAVVAEYSLQQGNDVNSHRDEGFLIGVTEDGDIHRWEKGETGPDYGKLLVDSSEPGKALENEEYSWAETADRPALLQDADGGTPQQVAETYLEDNVEGETSAELDQLFN